jgi:hypothetical protein
MAARSIFGVSQLSGSGDSVVHAILASLASSLAVDYAFKVRLLHSIRLAEW